MSKINVPLTVPKTKVKTYLKNYDLATHDVGRLFLFAGDQKVEHLNDDFYGQDINKQDNNPEHLFQIASQAKIGVFATQLGLIAKYGNSYKKVPYLIKLNSKTKLSGGDNPVSKELATVKEVIEFKKQSKLKILGIGYTVYIGGDDEADILQEASQAIIEAHKQGLIAVIWMYPRGKNIKNEEDIHLIAGGAGVALCLGADFVKVKYPYDGREATAKKFKEVVEAAGRTKVICAGGSKISPKDLLKNIYYQINTAKTSGSAIGRNIHQYSLEKAVKLANAISALVYQKAKLEKAIKMLEK
jgi:fructose-bisphosphate aldolase/6-deoxy-5-ketofructose 1-phosphate synthase